MITLIPHITASGLERVEACPASVALPAILRSSEAAERGTAIHKFAERILTGCDKATALAHVPEEWRDTCANFDVLRSTADLRRGTLRVEQAYGINVNSIIASDLGMGLARAYPDPTPGDVFGTTDVEAIRSWDGRAVVVDWKSGAQDVTPPADNLQLRFAVRAVSLLRNAGEVEARIAVVRGNGHVDIDKYVFRSFELEEIDEQLSELYARAFKIANDADRGVALLPVLNPGKWCQYCPAMPACPSKVALARALLPDLAETTEKLQAMTPEQQGKAFLKYREAKQMIEVLHEAFNTLARANPIPVGHDKEVREISYLKRSFDRQAAYAMLRAKGATEEEIESLEPKVRTSRVDVYKMKGAAPARRRKAS